MTNPVRGTALPPFAGASFAPAFAAPAFAGAAFATAVLLLGAPAAAAHAFLATAAPAVGSTVGTPPAAVSITFTEAVEPAFSAIAVTDSGGHRVDTAAPHLDGDDHRLAVAVKRLPPGTYTVTWHATATDTHHTQGRFTFTVAAKGSVSP